MKNQYLIIRMSPAEFYDRTFLMRGFDVKRIEKVIGVIVVVGTGLLSSESKIHHLSRIDIDLLQSDTQQKWARLSWSSVDSSPILDGMRLLPDDLRDAILAMRTNRIYHVVDTTIPAAFRDRHTSFVYTPSAARKLVTRAAKKTASLDDFTTEEIINHLRTRLNAKITIEL